MQTNKRVNSVVLPNIREKTIKNHHRNSTSAELIKKSRIDLRHGVRTLGLEHKISQKSTRRGVGFAFGSEGRGEENGAAHRSAALMYVKAPPTTTPKCKGGGREPQNNV